MRGRVDMREGEATQEPGPGAATREEPDPAADWSEGVAQPTRMEKSARGWRTRPPSYGSGASRTGRGTSRSRPRQAGEGHQTTGRRTGERGRRGALQRRESRQSAGHGGRVRRRRRPRDTDIGRHTGAARGDTTVGDQPASSRSVRSCGSRSGAWGRRRMGSRPQPSVHEEAPSGVRTTQQGSGERPGAVGWSQAG